ncbi:hypothetical protein ACSMX9_21755 [Streptomyces sp. LE64]|uniref:hypothetical protein n=1 Tax=Streptomyces sp. LE64 TaxID=3448653 RepID=UPI00404328B1
MFHVLRHAYASVQLEAGLADAGHKVPEKSLAADWATGLALKPHLRSMITMVAATNVKYKETARGGLAVNIIEC